MLTLFARMGEIIRRFSMLLSLKRLLTLFLVISLIPGAIILAMVLSSYGRALRGDAQIRLLQTTAEYTNRLEGSLDQIRNALHQLASKSFTVNYCEGDEAYKIMHLAEMRDSMNDMSRYVPQISFSALATSGRLLFRSGSGSSMTLEKYLACDRYVNEYFAEPSRKVAYYTFEDTTEKKQYVLVFVPVNSHSAVIAFADIEDLLSVANGAEGLFVLAYGDVLLSTNLSAEDARILGQCTDSKISLNGYGYGVIQAAIPRMHWTITIAYAIPSFIDIMRGVQIPLLLLGLFVVGEIALLAGIYLCIVNPIRDISRLTLQVYSASDKVINPFKSRSELNVLANSINGMKEKVYELNRQINEERVQRMRMDMAQLHAHNLFLQAQIHPHLLYNMLECICGMAIEDHSVRIREATLTLAELYRYCAQSADATLEEELASIELFSRLIHFRHEKLFTLRCDVDECFQSFRMPRMILEPIVENAVQHGFKSGTGLENIIVIRSKFEENRLHLIIEDNGCGIPLEVREALSQALATDQEPRAGARHIGIQSVNRRLKYVFGPQCGVRVEPQETGGTRVTLIMKLNPNDVSLSLPHAL